MNPSSARAWQESDFIEQDDGDEKQDDEEEIIESNEVVGSQSPPQFKNPKSFTRSSSIMPAVSYDNSSSSSSRKTSPAGSLSSSASNPSNNADAGDEPQFESSFVKSFAEKKDRVLYQSESYQSHKLVELAYKVSQMRMWQSDRLY